MTTLTELNYQLIKPNNSLFTKFSNRRVLYILIYVDDFIITGNNGSEISYSTTQTILN